MKLIEEDDSPAPIEREFVLLYQDNSLRWIKWCGSLDSLEDLKQFGEAYRDSMTTQPDHYHLNVDPRRDFNKVLRYIQNTYLK